MQQSKGFEQTADGYLCGVERLPTRGSCQRDTPKDRRLMNRPDPNFVKEHPASKDPLDQMSQRISAPQSIGPLRSWVVGGFVVAVAFTAFVGIFSWYSARRAEDDATWVSHTQDVLTIIETTFRNLADVEAGSRGFALSGHLPILEAYETARGEVDTDFATLRRLTADNPSQQHRLDILQPRIAEKLAAAQILVTARRTAGTIPTPQQLDEAKLLMDAAGATIIEMEAEEKRLLLARVQNSIASRHLAVLGQGLGALVGMLLLGAAGFAIYRQINITARANALNDQLYKRVQGHATALVESEGRLAGVIQSAMDAILTVDEKQRVVLFNAAAERMFQCAASEAMGQPLARFIPQRFHSAHAEHVKKFDETGVTSRAMGVKNSLWAVRADGQEFQIEASISQLEAGGKKLFTAILRDVSERIRAEAAREQFAAVVESSDDAIISKTLDGIITSWNPGAEKIFGYSSTEAIGKMMSIIIPPERASEESHILKEIGLGRGVRHFDTTRLRKDGAYVHVSVTISPIKNSRGEIVGASKIARDITERKLAEEALRESEERFRLFIEYAPAELAMFDREMRYLHVSQRWRADYGLGDRDLSGVSHYEVFPDVPERWKEAHRRGLSGEILHSKEDRFERAGHVVQWVQWEVRPWHDSAGAIGGILIFTEDITERKQAEEARRESEQRFQAMADGIPQLAWMADADGSIFWYNQRWYDYTGKTLEEMQGWGWQSVHDPKLLPPVMIGWKNAIAKGVPFEMEFPLRDADGRFREFLTRVMPSKDKEGRVVRWFGTNTDIRERKEVEERLSVQAEDLARQAEELALSRSALTTQALMLRSVLDSMGEGLVAADEHGKFVIWNPAAERILGLTAADIPSEKWTEYYGVFLSDTVTPFPPDQLPLARAIRGEANTGELFVRNRNKSQGAWVEVNANPLTDANGMQRGGVVALRDISEQKVAEQKIRKLNEELEVRVLERTVQLAEANEELESFTYSVAHDLRAPLRQISGFSGILVEDFRASLDPEAQRYLQRIQQGTSKMGQLVDELLNLARVGRQTPNPRTVDLNSVVREVIEMLQPEIEGRNIEWTIAKLSSADCDPTLIKQVFQNLISNAIKYSRPRSPAVIEIGQIRQGASNTIFVRDNGVGFSMKYADKLFGVFQRLHRAEDFEGTGVGLATVHRIIKKHQGKVWAEAELDKGATFYFTVASQEDSELKAQSAVATVQLGF